MKDSLRDSVKRGASWRRGWESLVGKCGSDMNWGNISCRRRGSMNEMTEARGSSPCLENGLQCVIKWAPADRGVMGDKLERSVFDANSWVLTDPSELFLPLVLPHFRRKLFTFKRCQSLEKKKIKHFHVKPIHSNVLSNANNENNTSLTYHTFAVYNEKVRN